MKYERWKLEKKLCSNLRQHFGFYANNVIYRALGAVLHI